MHSLSGMTRGGVQEESYINEVRQEEKIQRPLPPLLRLVGGKSKKVNSCPAGVFCLPGLKQTGNDRLPDLIQYRKKNKD